MDFFKVKTIEEAYEIMKKAFPGFELDTEMVDIECALCRISAEVIKSQIDVPHFNRSVVDGYAVRVADVSGAGASIPAFLKLIGHADMGELNKKELKDNECMYVPTGGMVPKGTDAMVMIEHTQEINSNEIAVYKNASMYENMLLIGDDIKRGETALQKGKMIYAQDIGVLASTGHSKAAVYKRPTFSVISTGDEIVSPNSKLTPGKIKDINTYTLCASVEGFGGKIISRQVIGDDYNEIKQAVIKAAENNDVVLLSGGSSVGNKDYTYSILKELPGSQILIHGLNVKPGKPTIVAKAFGKPIIGLPGQPASALIVLIKMLDILYEIFYKTNLKKEYIMAKLDQNVASAPGRKTYQMVSIKEEGQETTAVVLRGKSGMISLLSKAYGYIIIDENIEGREKSDTVKVFPLR